MSKTLTSNVDASQAPPTGPTPPWEWNRRVGWLCACLGVLTGSVMGLWSFDGPLPPPAWLGEYGDTARRLARLGHIAFFGLGILDLLLAHELRRSALGPSSKRLASWAMIFGNIVLPVNLFAAAAYHPLKYFMGVPVSAVFVAFVLAAYGAWAGKAPHPEGDPDHDDTA
jgi:hypothetical protein